MPRFATIMALAVLGAMSGAADAFAQTYYVGLRGGYNQPHESEARVDGQTGLDAEFDSAAMAAAAFGFEWVDGWRFDGELSWRRSDFDSIDNTAIDRGEAEIYAAMVNVYYGLRPDATVNPYLGGGVGAARLAVDDLDLGGATVDDKGAAMAWQAIAGVDFALSASWKLSLEYRYFAVDEVKMADSLGAIFKTDYLASSALLGLRVGF